MIGSLSAVGVTCSEPVQTIDYRLIEQTTQLGGAVGVGLRLDLDGDPNIGNRAIFDGAHGRFVLFW